MKVFTADSKDVMTQIMGKVGEQNGSKRGYAPIKQEAIG